MIILGHKEKKSQGPVEEQAFSDQTNQVNIITTVVVYTFVYI